MSKLYFDVLKKRTEFAQNIGLRKQKGLSEHLAPVENATRDVGRSVNFQLKQMAAK